MSAPDSGPEARLLYFGMAGCLSTQPLAALLATGHRLAGVILWASPAGPADPIALRRPPTRIGRALPLAQPAAPPSIADLAWSHGLPLYAVRGLADPATLATIASLQPDLIVVTCFPRLLPDSLLALCPLGGINLHPSLLPVGRGPAPRFWTFRHGWPIGGVTIHQLTQTFDAGPVLGQATFPLPDGLSGAAFDEQAATVGGRLLIETIAALAAGTARPTPQEPALATYDPWPAETDFVLDLQRSARWAYNFVHGVTGSDGVVTVEHAGRRWPIAEALAYEPDSRPGAPLGLIGDQLWVACRPGRLGLRLAVPTGTAHTLSLQEQQP